MTDVTTTLPAVLGNLTRNREQVEINLKKVRTAVGQLDDDSIASIKQLLGKFEHVQSVGQFVQAYVQAEQLEAAAAEMDALIATVQTAIDDDSFSSQAQAQLSANDKARTAPLPAAGQAIAPAPAVAGQGSDVAS